ncbi:MAG: asparagine synthase (glutamine-hydrolyzing), partial [Bryocella sp.]
MCGIAGFVTKSETSDAAGAIQRMTDAIRHRGPDGEGQLVWGNCALGHRRLAIIDLTDAGLQPMSYKDGRYALTFNGEIYNYLELRAELQEHGYRFASETDSEVILAAYDFWGKDCLERFNGMWAFAILDRERHELFCARDRFGIKPFYYVDNQRAFAFASEIKALFEWMPERVANREVMVRFLSVSVPDVGDDTFFAGVKRLGAGCRMLLDVRTGAATIERYYHLKPADTRGASTAELIGRFRETFDNSVRLRLRSDVQVGTCLSGGLDSSSIAATAALMNGMEQSGTGPSGNGRRFAAVTAQSMEKATDETEFARAVVESSNLEWYTVRPTAEDAQAMQSDVLWHQEEPVESGSQVMQYAVMRLARQNNIPVLLDGQGADETLLGYPWHHGASAAVAMQRLNFVKAARAVLSARQQGSARDVVQAAAYALEQMTPRARAWRYGRR